MQWDIVLESTQLNNRMTEIEEGLTYALDQLEVLEAEAEKMAYFWEGNAQLQWIKSFRKDLMRVKQFMNVAIRQEALLKKLAISLAKLEQSVEAVVQAM